MPKTAAQRAPRKTIIQQVQPHLDRMASYIKGLADGSIYCAEVTRLAAQRHQDWLSKQNDPDFPYYFDLEEVAKAIRFCHLLKHVKGDLAGERLVLPEWGLFFIGWIFGWRFKRNHARVTRQAFGWVPRGNAKSTILSAASGYAAFAEGGQADAFSIATSKEQARIVWGDAQAMLRASPDVAKALGIEVLASSLVQPATNSSFKPLASKDTHLDGLNVSWAVVDETHCVTQAVWDVIETALGKRENACMVSISTAGMSLAGLGRQKYLLCRKVLEGTLTGDAADQIFALIYEAPEGADLYAESTWRAANPLYDYSAPMRRDLKMKAEKARKLPTERALFFVKHLNIWQSNASPWLDIKRWDDCAQPLDREDFKGESCWIGLDAASTSDITAKALVFPRTREDGQQEFVVFVDSYLPELAIQDGRNILYGQWVEDGHLKTLGEETIDQRLLKEAIEEDRESYDLQEICSDPNEVRGLLGELEQEGYIPIPVKTTYADMNDPMKRLEELVSQKRIIHDGNPCLRWQMANIVAKRRDEQIRPIKDDKHPENKIDAGVAILCALKRAIGSDQSEVSGVVIYDVAEILKRNERK